jgi:hypothetical protein
MEMVNKTDDIHVNDNDNDNDNDDIDEIELLPSPDDEEPSSDDETWFSKGFPWEPSWGWNKAAPKKSLYAIDMAHTANTFMLNIVELVHWAPIIPAFLMAQSVLSNSEKWTHYFDDNELRTLLFLLAPIISFFGGLPGIMMHTYEGWQVAPFDSPLRGPNDDTNVVVSDKNNQWLRIVAYFFIFNMQYIGLQTFSYAVLGSCGMGGFFEALSILGFFVSYLGSQDYKATFYFKWRQTAGGSVFPLAWTTLIPFILVASLNLYAFAELGTLVFPGFGGTIWALVPPILVASGGAIEGLLAETIFDQKIHAFAVILFNIGFWLQLNMINKGAEMLPIPYDSIHCHM